MGSELIEAVDSFQGHFAGVVVPMDRKKIVPRAYFNAQALFDKSQIFIELAAEGSQAVRIIGLEANVMR